MIMDKLVMFHDDTAPTTAGSYVGDSVALRETAKISEEYAGEPVEVVVQVTKTFTSGGAGTLDLRFTSGNSAALASPVTQGSTGALALATLVAGTKYRFPLALNIADADASHIGVIAVVATATMTAGTISAWIQRAGEDQHTIND